MTGSERLVISGGIANQAFLEHALELSGVGCPTILVDRSSAPTSEAFDRQFKESQALQDALGVHVIQLQEEQREAKYTKHREAVPTAHGLAAIDTVDVLWVGDGDTSRILRQWQQFNLGQRIVERLQEGQLVVAGNGAGAQIFFEQYFNNSARYVAREGDNWLYNTLDGLGVVSGRIATRYHDNDNLNRSREWAFRDTLYYQRDWLRGIALDTNAGIICADGVAKAVQFGESDNANTYRFFGIERDTAYRVRPGEVIASLSTQQG